MIATNTCNHLKMNRKENLGLPPLTMLRPKKSKMRHKSQPKPVLSGQLTVMTIGSPSISDCLMITTSSCRIPIFFFFFKAWKTVKDLCSSFWVVWFILCYAFMSCACYVEEYRATVVLWRQTKGKGREKQKAKQIREREFGCFQFCLSLLLLHLQ